MICDLGYEIERAEVDLEEQRQVNKETLEFMQLIQEGNKELSQTLDQFKSFNGLQWTKGHEKEKLGIDQAGSSDHHRDAENADSTQDVSSTAADKKHHCNAENADSPQDVSSTAADKKPV